MLYCGYQGCGKTTYCKNTIGAVDLDSSNFPKEKNWEIKYIEKALKISASGKDVFISAHKEVIQRLIYNNCDFTILAPSENKQAWRARLSFRYFKYPTLANLKALVDFVQNYDSDLKYYKSLEKKGYTVLWIEAKISTNLSQKLDK